MSENHTKRIIVILQARMGASRLFGKPLKKVLNRTLLSYQLERLRRAKRINQIVVATTVEDQDSQIVELCKSEKIPFFRGSESNVLDRYYQAAKQFKANIIVRITGDCPLIDPEILDQVVDYYVDQWPKYDYVSNSLVRSFPRGLDVEIFSFDLLKRAEKEGNLPEEREHVTPYFYTHPELFSLGNFSQSLDMSEHRWTVDTEEDLALVTKILETIYPKKPDFTTDDVLEVLRQNPEWVKINAHIRQKPLRS